MKSHKSRSNLNFIKSWAKLAKNKSRRNTRTKRRPTKRRLTKRRFGKGG
jgi:hypothetical protein